MQTNEFCITDRVYVPKMTAPLLVQLSFSFLAGSWIPNTDNGLCYPGVSLVETGGGTNVWRVVGLPFAYNSIRIRAKSYQIPNASAATMQGITQDATEHAAGNLAFSVRAVAAPGAVIAPVSGHTFNLLLWVDGGYSL